MPGGNSNHTRIYSQLRGGIAIHNPNSDPAVPGGAYGTLGFVATSDGSDRWIVSCYHVLCRKGADFPDGVSEPIYHPFSQWRPAPVAIVTQEGTNRGLDCAAARVLSPSLAVGQVLGIGKLRDPVEAQIGMRVIKSGAETGVTEGRITKVEAENIEIAPLGYPDDYELSEGGDSGSLWVDADTNAPVGLHYRGSERGTPERAYAKPIHLILEALDLRLVIDMP